MNLFWVSCRVGNGSVETQVANWTFMRHFNGIVFEYHGRMQIACLTIDEKPSHHLFIWLDFCRGFQVVPRT